MACHERLADLDFDVKYLARHENLLALLGNGKTIFAGEGVRLDADPDDGGGGGLSERNRCERYPCSSTSPPWTRECRGPEELRCHPILPSGGGCQRS